MERDLGYRRIQSTGRGSYIISLPKEWVGSVELQKGSEVAFKIRDDSSLVLVPRKILERKEDDEKPRLKEYWVLVEPKEDPQSVCHKIIALYVVSANLLHIRFKGEEGSSEHRMVIKNLVRNALLGSEIVDETSNEIVLQILVEHPEFPVERAIRRMAILALSADRDAISASKMDMDQKLIQNVIEAYNDVNRLNLYVIRQLKFGLEQNSFKELGFRTPKEFLGYRIVANDIKSIAANAKNLADNITTLRKLIEDRILFLKEPVDEEVYTQIFDFNSSVHGFFEDSLKAMFKRDYKHADRIITELERFASLENDLITLLSSKKLDPSILSIFRLILDSSRRIMEYSRDIAEVTLNRTIEEISLMQTYK